MANNLEIIIVDNGSTDKTWEILKRYYESKRIYLYRYLGKTIASVRNYGARKGKGDILAFLDGDCVVPENWIKVGVDILKTNINVGCVGFKNTKPQIDDSWVEKAWSCISSTSKYSGTNYVDWLSSFNFIIWKHIFWEVGGFNEQLVTCEDADLGYKIGKRSKLMISDQVNVRHLGESKTLKEFFKREYWRGSSNLKQILMNKNKNHEILSIIVPVGYLIGILSIVALNIYNYIYLKIHGGKIFIISLIFLAMPPLILTIVKQNQKINIKIQFGIIVLSFIYLIARGLAVFKIRK